jgi:hypothetical protein
VLEDVPAEALAAEEAAGADPVVLGACVVVFEASPGNCNAVSGLIEVAAFMPPTDPVADPPDSGMVDVGRLKGSESTVPFEPVWVS